MTLRELLHKRILIAVKTGYSGSSTVAEYKIVEVSPSGNFVKVQDMDGRKYWKHSADIVPIEVLQYVYKSPGKEDK